MKQINHYFLVVLACCLFFPTTFALAQCENTTADVPVTPPESLTFCAGISDPADFAPGNIPTPDETGSTDFTFVVTSLENVDNEGNLIITNLSPDGVVNYNLLGTGTHCVSGLAYNQSEIDALATAVNNNADLFNIIFGIPIDFFPLPVPASLDVVIGLLEATIGEITIPDVFSGLNTIDMFLEVGACLAFSSDPYYCVEVTANPTACAPDDCMANVDLAPITPATFAICSGETATFNIDSVLTLNFGPSANGIVWRTLTVSPMGNPFEVPPGTTVSNTTGYPFAGDFEITGDGSGDTLWVVAILATYDLDQGSRIIPSCTDFTEAVQIVLLQPGMGDCPISDGDLCSHSFILASFPNEGETNYYGPYDNTPMSVSDTDPLPNCFIDNSLEHTMWFTFIGDGNVYHIKSTADCSGGLNLNEFNSYIDNGDVQMAAYTGVCETSLIEIACNEDGIGSTSDNYFAELTIDTEVGTVYYLMTDGWNGSDGSFCFQIEQIGPACMANAQVAVSPQNNTFCQNFSAPQDIALVNLPTPAETGTDNFTLGITNTAQTDETGESLVLALTEDGAFDFNGFATGDYCFYGLAYNQSELNEVAAFLNENPALGPFFGLTPADFPLPSELPIADLLGLVENVSGPFTISDVEQTAAFLPNLGLSPLCFDISDQPLYCITVTDDINVCAGIPGDFCTSALNIMNFPSEGEILYYGPYDNTSMTVSDTDPIPTCFAEGTLENTMWFTFVGDGHIYDIQTSAVCSGGLNLEEFDLYITDGDAQMAVYTGDCEGDLTEINCNEDGAEATPDNFFSALTIETEVGITYYIMLDGYQGSTGMFCFEIEEGQACTANVDLAPNTPLTFEICSNETAIFNIDSNTLDFGPTSANGIVWNILGVDPMGQHPNTIPSQNDLGLFLGHPFAGDFEVPGNGSGDTVWVVGIIGEIDLNAGQVSFDNCLDFTEAIQIIYLPDGSEGCPDTIDCSNSNVDLAPDTPSSIMVCVDDSTVIFIDETTLEFGEDAGDDPTVGWLLFDENPDSGENGLDLANAGDPSFLAIIGGNSLILVNEATPMTLWAVAANFPNSNGQGNFNIGECLDFTDVVEVIFIASNEPCPPVNCMANANVAITPLTNDTFCLGSSDPADFLPINVPSASETLSTDFAFVITDENNVDANGSPIIVGLSADGSFDFNNAGSGTYCFYGFAYNQDEVDELGEFLNQNPVFVDVIGIPTDILPLPIPFPLEALFDVTRPIGDLTISGVEGALGTLTSILPTDLCTDASNEPLYCVEVTNDPILCGNVTFSCPPNGEVNSTLPTNDAFCLGSSDPADFLPINVPSASETLSTDFAFVITDENNVDEEGDPIIVGLSAEGSFDFNNATPSTYCFSGFAYNQDQINGVSAFLNANPALAGIIGLPPDALPLPIPIPLSLEALFDLIQILIGDLTISGVEGALGTFAALLPTELCFDASNEPLYCVEVTDDPLICGPFLNCVEAAISAPPICAGTTPNTYSFDLIVTGGGSNDPIMTATVGTK